MGKTPRRAKVVPAVVSRAVRLASRESKEALRRAEDSKANAWLCCGAE